MAKQNDGTKYGLRMKLILHILLLLLPDGVDILVCVPQHLADQAGQRN